MPKLLIDIIGWCGSLMVILAYGLNSYQRIASDSWTFLLLNFAGGVCLIIYSVYYTAYANTFINVVWVIIALPALVRLMKRYAKR
ncbi:MAG: hypothetical protein N2044_08770 [Cyclobacteriaceae bacterium]|nr:hypothetical protein [Cyclobacteriaceae bacterium]MCX7637922.1 hypothetical protein [Cyclobacteriaceae bacterium]MDW8331458.1 hypothetical protein [Cyclobacteriaceae bacterium]